MNLLWFANQEEPDVWDVVLDPEIHRNSEYVYLLITHGYFNEVYGDPEVVVV